MVIGLFKKSKSKVSISSPGAFRESIRNIKKGGVTVSERNSIKIAQERAKLQLKRKNLSAGERRQFKSIKNTDLPKITRRKKRSK